MMGWGHGSLMGWELGSRLMGWAGVIRVDDLMG